MSVYLKPGQLKIKDENGDYNGINVVALESTEEYLTEIETKGTQIKAQIEAKGAATKASIPEDYTALSEEVSELNERLEPIANSLFVNMVNPNDIEVYNLTNYVAGHYFSTSNTSKMVVVPCKPNTKYTCIETLTSGRFGAFSSEEFPANHVDYNLSATSTSGVWYSSPQTITTGETDRYLAIKFYDSGVDTEHTPQEHLNTLMVAEGDFTEFYPFGAILINPELLSNATYEAIDERTNALIETALENISDDTYGIKIDTDGTVTRVGAADGKVNDYVVGSDFVGSGQNDFDSIYPWSAIRTCNINIDSYGDMTITYKGETGFARDGSNGSVYVEIPKFFTKRYLDDDGNEVILISGTRHGGFEVEPAFFDSETGEEIEKIYVGAYFTQTGVNVMNSISGVFPASNESLEEFKLKTGEIYDFVTLQAIQKLMSIEFGKVNMSSIFGGFSYLPWSSSVRVETSASNTNTGQFMGDIRLTNIGVGNTISIASRTGEIQNRTITAIGEVTQIGGSYHRSITFDGDPVDLVANTTLLYCTGQKTGFTDSLPYHTGRTNLNSGSTYSNQFRYRDIEGLWGTLGEIMDGVIVKDLKMYWSNIKTDYGDVTKCHRLNFPVPLQNTYTNSQGALPPQIKKMGWDFRYPTIAFPEILADKSEQYYGDLFFSIENAGPDGYTFPDGYEFIGISSMAWDGHEDNGLYTIRFWSSKIAKSWLYGSRAIIRHL